MFAIQTAALTNAPGTGAFNAIIFAWSFGPLELLRELPGYFSETSANSSAIT